MEVLTFDYFVPHHINELVRILEIIICTHTQIYMYRMKERKKETKCASSGGEKMRAQAIGSVIRKKVAFFVTCLSGLSCSGCVGVPPNNFVAQLEFNFTRFQSSVIICLS